MDMTDFTASNSPYLKAKDIGDARVPVTIREVTNEQMQDGETKPVCWFQNKSKGLVLNKTNARTLADAMGVETAAWTGKAIKLYTTETTFGPGLRVDVTGHHPGSRAPRREQPPVVLPNGHEEPAPADFDDDIPF